MKGFSLIMRMKGLIMMHALVRRQKDLIVLLVIFVLLGAFLFVNWEEWQTGCLDFWLTFEFWVLIIYASVIATLILISQLWGLDGYYARSQAKVKHERLAHLPADTEAAKYPGPTREEVISSVTHGLKLVFHAMFVEFLLVLVAHDLLLIWKPEFLQGIL